MDRINNRIKHFNRGIFKNNFYRIIEDELDNEIEKFINR